MNTEPDSPEDKEEKSNALKRRSRRFSGGVRFPAPLFRRGFGNKRAFAGRFLFFLRRVLRNDHLLLGGLAVGLGLAVGCGVILFRECIRVFQYGLYGYGGEHLPAHVAELSPWRLFLTPVAGAALISLFYRGFLYEKRPQAVALVVAGARGRARMPGLKGLLAVLGAALSIGAGGAVGREGPAVLLGASFGAWFSAHVGFHRSFSRTLLGCGAAAAVAASFNAPIAGALFAHEVVIGHYAMNAFTPVVIASVAATVVSRGWYGDFPSFVLPDLAELSFWELPLIGILGVFCGVVAFFFIQFLFKVEDFFPRLPLPRWSWPLCAGVVLGGLAILCPEVLGVGYHITDEALKGNVGLKALAGIALIRFLGTTICLGSGYGGGVFSPSLSIGACVGGMFGFLFAFVFPEISAPGDYALVGMGSVAAAVMGAPISTVLIVFEMTGNYSLTSAVMIGVVTASTVNRQLLNHRSLFYADLLRRSIDVETRMSQKNLARLKVEDVMRKDIPVIQDNAPLKEVRAAIQKAPTGFVFMTGRKGVLHGTITLRDLKEMAFDHSYDERIRARDVARHNPPFLSREDTLEAAVQVMADEMREHMAVVDSEESQKLVGWVHETEILMTYNRALLARSVATG